jgi:zinc/manganese transport system substrate-binding protein
VRAARFLIPMLVALAACGGGDAGGARLTVVATTTQAGDLVRAIGGRRVDVRQLLRPNSDPHGYEPRPSDARALADAELVVRSGGDLDEWLVALVKSAGGKAPTVNLIDSVPTIKGESGDVDPHWWQDPRNGERAGAALGRALGRADPDGRARYERRAAAYSRRLRKLDDEIAACMGAVPEGQRKLVTTHDALGYFARRYDVELVGALIPSLSSQAQPSARQTERLVHQIEREGVQAIFPESSLNPKLERAVARETGARVGDPLWADSLGPAGSSGATYTRSLAANANAMVRGMTGGARSCRARAASGGAVIAAAG